MKQSFTKKLRANKRRIAGIVAAVLAVLMLLGAMAPFLSVYGATEAAFEIEAEVGFSSRYVVGGVTPAKVFIKNNGDDFKGEAQIKVNVSEDMTMALFNVYAYPVELPKGSSTVIDMNIVIPVIKANHKIILVNEKEKTVAQRAFTATAIDPESVLLGVLSDQKNSLNYLRQIETGESAALGNNVIALDEKSFPDTEETLSNFDAVCINDFDTRRLSPDQRTALEIWLKSGGVLILGTGQNFDKVIHGLEGMIPEISQRGSVDIPAPEEWIRQAPTSLASTHIRISRLNLSDTYALEDDGAGHVMTAVAQAEGGSGLVVAHSFDLGTAPIPGLNERTGFLTAYYGRLLANIDTGYISGHAYSQGTDYLINNLPAQSNRIVLTVFTIIMIYGVFIGPFLYLILKKKDIREKGLVIVPVISVAVSFVILLLSSRGIYQNPIVNTVNFIEISEGAATASAEINAGVFSPKKGDVKVELTQAMPISVRSQDPYRYYNQGNIYTGIVEEENQSKILYGRAPAITYYDKASWDTNTFSTRAQVDLAEGLRGEFYLDGRRLKGELVNGTGLALQDVIVGIGYSMQKYDVLKPGETLVIDQEVDLSQSGNAYNGFYDLYQWDADMETTGEEKRQAHFKQNITAYFYEYRAGNVGYSPLSKGSGNAIAVSYATRSAVPYPAGGNSQSARVAQNPLAVHVICFNYDQLYSGDIRVNGRTPTVINTNFVQMQTPLHTDRMQSYDLPYDVLRCSYVQANVNFETYDTEIYMYEEGDAEFTFTVPEQTRVTLIQFKWEWNTSPESLEIWNEKAKVWEELSTLPYRENANDYVDQESCVRVRVCGAQEYVPIPSIRIQGGR